MSVNDMVNATVPTEAERHYLKTIEGAWVDLKPLPYGQLIERRDKASRMSMTTDRRNQDNSRMDIDMLQAEMRRYEFNHCIVDHNLGDDQGNQLNFTNPASMNVLDPRVGQEIEQLIDNLNQLEDIDEENFTAARTSSSQVVPTPLGGSTEGDS